MQLTPMTIKKFISAPIEVNLWNGNFNKAVVKVKNNKIEYELELSDTHDMLRNFSGKHSEEITFVVWQVPYRGIVQKDIPPELAPVVQKMREMVKMTDEYALQVWGQNVAAIQEFHEQFLM